MEMSSNVVTEDMIFMDTVEPIDFNDSSTYHDRIFIVERRKFYVLREVLSLSSDNFRTLFNTDCKKAKETVISLEEVSADSFEFFLNFIYPEHCRNPECLTDTSIMLELVSLSFRFRCPVVFRQAKKAINHEYSLFGLRTFDFIKFVSLALLYDVGDFKAKIIEVLQDHAYATEKKNEIINGPEQIKDFVLAVLLDKTYPHPSSNRSDTVLLGNDVGEQLRLEVIEENQNVDVQLNQVQPTLDYRPISPQY